MIQRVLRRKDVFARLNISRVTLWRWETSGVFPPIRTIGPGVEGWLESDLQDYFKTIKERPLP